MHNAPSHDASGVRAPDLLRALLRCQSITPRDDGASGVLADAARRAGFTVDTLVADDGREGVHNLLGVWGEGQPVLAFAGHTDVVPVPDAARWRHPPFGAQTHDGAIFGRGAVDMKGALAAFVAACDEVRRGPAPPVGTVVLLVTGDEEKGGPAGMRALLRHVRGRIPAPDACLIGEPSCEGFFGQGIRVGRRGSLNVEVRATGIEGHVAWPDRARNALRPLIAFLHAAWRLDLGGADEVFPPTHLEVTQATADSGAGNVIPGVASARLNIRFNRHFTPASLRAQLDALVRDTSPDLSLTYRLSGEPYLHASSRLADVVATSVEAVVGRAPSRNAGGGVSDGRFIRDLCPVAEFGLVGDLAHKVDEHVPLADLAALQAVYVRVLRGFLGGAKIGEAAPPT